MLSVSFSRKVLLLLLLALLAAPLASADPFRPATAVSAAPPDLLGRLWSLLTAVWSETGCHIDPDGRCIPGTAQEPQTDNDRSIRRLQIVAVLLGLSSVP